MASVGTEVGQTPTTKPARFAITPGLLVAFSLFYFTDVILRASEKYFWFDELVTLGLCRLDFRSIWHQLQLGADFNPPFFYFLEKASKAAFGENLIGMRVPEMIGFWVACLCLYRFVSRRVGPLAGAIAMVLPTLTGAFYYAYEARPFGMVLGFAGLALVCWQKYLEDSRSRAWLVTFSLCLLGCAMLHCYAVLIALPFATAELVRTARRRQINWPMWIALTAPGAASSFLYIPLLLPYRAVLSGTEFTELFAPSVGKLADFFSFLLLPCISVIVFTLAVLAAARIVASRFTTLESKRNGDVMLSEVIVGFSFLALPILGLILAKVVHGPFIGRYFTAAVLGLCILVGLGAGARKPMNWAAVTIAVITALPVAWQFSALLWHRYRGVAEELGEPSSRFNMNTTLGGPLARYPKLLSLPHDSRPIGIMQPMDYTYLLYYAPELRQRVYYVRRSKNDFAFPGFQHFHTWAPFEFNQELTPDQFLRLSPRVLVLGVPGDLDDLARLLKMGPRMLSLQVSAEKERYMAELETGNVRSN